MSEALETLGKLAKAAVTDLPACPRCKGRVGMPCYTSKGELLPWASWNHRANPGDALVCPACGAGWSGTEVEVRQAVAGQLAWELHEVGGYLVAAMEAGAP